MDSTCTAESGPAEIRGSPNPKEEDMRRRQYCEERIIGILKQAEMGKPIGE